MSTLSDSSIAFVGSGTMAEAMIKALLQQQLIPPKQVTASGPRQERGKELEEKYGIQTTVHNREAVEGRSLVVLTVKPQTLKQVLRELKGGIAPQGLVLSIVAGASTQVISQGLDHPAVVRSMPNTPAQVGKGMTVWTATPQVSEAQREQVRSILRAFGEEYYTDEEAQLDMATALSGTGPTYVFMFMEALVDAGVHLGFPRRVAQQLVLQTVEGSAALARATALHPAQLRDMVTSPGGTSAEAIYQLEKGGLRTVLSKAVWAAHQKSKYLGGLIQG
ncbi:MAG: pyrroline-5-carboxylate reductase [Chloroflexi bacterium]|nr:pyrroline-5-carboxylate reductase [Chloroflexota bacterium]